MSRGALNVLLVHGIGDHPKEFVGEFERQLRADLQRRLNALARRYKLSAPPPADALNLIPGRWAPVTEGIQKEVEQRIFHGPVDFLRWFGMRFMGDVVAYQGRAVYDEIHRALAANLLDQVQPESGHLTIIAHSLGAVVASDFVYDHTEKIGSTLADRFGVAFSNFFTLGSPLVLYAMQSSQDGAFDAGGVLDRFDRPVRVESEDGVWLNLFAEPDIIGYPIRSINRFYSGAVTADVRVDVGDFWRRRSPLSHGRYWTDPHVNRIIAGKLAIDLAGLYMGLEGVNHREAIADYLKQITPPYPQPTTKFGRAQVMNRLARLAVW
jgi:pimeloyl-ACP methyl ester carboxylesterase